MVANVADCVSAATDRRLTMSHREQVSVPLPAELREYVQRIAEREVTSQAAVIRRLVADAARQDSRGDRAA
jgi:hypothetical protein